MHSNRRVKVFDMRGQLLGGAPLNPGDDVERVAKRLLRDKHNGGRFYDPLPQRKTYH